MSDFPKQRFVSGKNANRRFPMSASHVTTASIMNPAPTLCMDLVPGSSGKLTVKSFCRLDPLQRPMLSSMSMRNRTFFVRYASVWRPFYSFKEDTTYQSASASFIPDHVPTFNVVDLMEMFHNNLFSVVADVTDPYDFEYNGSRYSLTSFGRHCYKVLKSLGYDIMSVEVAPKDAAPFYVSALRLLSYAKILLDWYFPTQYVGLSSLYVNVQQIFMRESVYSLSYNDLLNIFSLFVVCAYDRDYFVSAWDNPAAPTQGLFSTYSLPDITLGGNDSTGSKARVYADANANGTVESVVQGDVNSLSRTTEYQLSMLQALTSFMKRHQIAGALSLDRWLADFGMQIRSDKLNRSIYLGSDVFPIQVGDVMSHSDTSGAALGDFAGKGVSYSQGHTFEFDAAEDFGCVIVVNSVVPEVGYVQGFDRHNLDYTRLQLYTSNFDGKGVQPINAVELYVSKTGIGFNRFGGQSGSGLIIFEVIFGWTQRYAHYKYLRSNLSGDFACPSVNVGLGSWHMFRLFDDASFSLSNQNIKHTLTFVNGADADQYYRIFNITDPTKGDPFKVVHQFYVDMSAPMLPMYEDYIFHEERQEGNKVVEIDNAGAKMN